MRFDKKKRRFIDANGELPPAQVRKHIEDFITQEKQDVTRQAAKLLAGLLTLDQFFALMKSKIEGWHGVSGVLAYGGVDQMTPERWDRIDEKIQSELQYLDDFEKEAAASFLAAQQIAADVAASIADQIPSGLDDIVESAVAESLADTSPSEAETVARQAVEESLSDSLDEDEIADVLDGVSVGEELAGALIGGMIASRAASYTGSMFATFENNRMFQARDSGLTMGQRDCVDDATSCDECPDLATNGPVPIDEIAEIGDSTCLGNCRCEISFFGAEVPDPDLGEHDAVFSQQHRDARFGPSGTLNQGPANAEGNRGART